MPLGACRLTRRVLVLIVALCASLGFVSCGSSAPKTTGSGLPNRVMASQGVTSTFDFGRLVIINGQNDTVPRVAPLSAGQSPGLMAISPSRNIVAAFDPTSDTVYSVDTTKESSIGQVHLPGPTTSFVIPTSNQVGYAAVPTAFVNGFSFLGAVEVMDLAGGLFTTIGVTNAQTVIPTASGSQLLVFGNVSDSVTLLTPGNAVPPVDTSCFENLPNSVCTVIPGFDRPVYGIVNGNTAYILNCGPQCGGNQASVMILNLGTLTITNTIPVDAATTGLLSGTTLYVAGTSPTNNACTGETTAATTCGRLDTIDLTSNTVTSSLVITDGYHSRMDISINGQVFIGSHDCTNIGNSGNPVGEVRGCLTILNTLTGALIFPPQNGDVDGLQSFTTREVEYVAQEGNLYVYNTNNALDVLLINDFITTGLIPIVGYVGDVKAIDFF
jgi:hypothetical protein